MRKQSILFVGESWLVNNLEVKGFDHFYMGGYGNGIKYIKEALSAKFDFSHMPAHEVPERFPVAMEELGKFDVLLVSDVGANSFLLHPDTFYGYRRTPNRLDLIAEYVRRGGGFGMIGGYMTYMGIEGKGFYKDTIIEEVLPVTLLSRDDRVEVPQGIQIAIEPDIHPILEGLPGKWPELFGYNRLAAKAGSTVIASYGEDPIITLGQYGEGRTLAYATDCAPHWSPPQFCEWEYYPVLWQRLIHWLLKEI